MGPVLAGTRVSMNVRPTAPRSRPAGWLRVEFVLLLAIHLIALALCIASVMGFTPVNAHPAGLAADGCHNDRKAGGRHCHRTATPKKGTAEPRRSEVYFANCSAARAAGAAPVRRGEPGYGPHLDCDGDGIGCE